VLERQGKILSKEKTAMSILFTLPGHYILALNIYGKFYRQYRDPDDPENAKGSGNQNHGKADGYVLPEVDSPIDFKAGGEHDSAA
jgi:hypothetical protein